MGRGLSIGYSSESVVWCVEKWENWIQDSVPVCVYTCVCVYICLQECAGVYVCTRFCMSQYEFMCMSVYKAKSVFLLDEEVTSTLCPVSSVHTSHTPSGSRGPHSVWSGAAPWLIYFLPGTTAVCGGQRLRGFAGRRKEGMGKLRFLFNLQDLTTINYTFHRLFKQKVPISVTLLLYKLLAHWMCKKPPGQSITCVWDAKSELHCWTQVRPRGSPASLVTWFKNRLCRSDNPLFFCRAEDNLQAPR